ncbi:MAG: hypothetical protein IJ849_12225 [Selenomonadaceae bacterium]|nr:hypothetical protein [Selenomonadaceae bacterium]
MLRTLNPEEIRLVAEILDTVQRLDIIGKAKAVGYISALRAEETRSAANDISYPAAVRAAV